MFKRMLSITIVIISLFIFPTACAKNEDLALNDVVNINYDKVTQLIIMSGHGKSIEVNNKETIKRLCENILNKYVINKSKNQDKKTGYNYYIDFYENDRKIGGIVFDGILEINDIYYDVIKPADHMTKLENFINSIK